MNEITFWLPLFCLVSFENNEQTSNRWTNELEVTSHTDKSGACFRILQLRRKVKEIFQ